MGHSAESIELRNLTLCSMLYALCVLFERRQRWINGHAKSVAISMILKMVIPMAMSLQIPRLKNFLRIGSARCVVLPKICLKKTKVFVSDHPASGSVN